MKSSSSILKATLGISVVVFVMGFALQAEALTIGTRVQTTDRLNVRSGPSKSYAIICTQPAGAFGTIVGGPKVGSGYTWWNINYDAGCSGWGVVNFLIEVSSPTITTQTTATQTTAVSKTLLPQSYTTTSGISGGQPVASMQVQDQSGTANNWNKYVEFGSGLYAGYRSYTLPASISPSSVATIGVKVNYRGPNKATQQWTWKIYDWTTGTYVTIGDNSLAPNWGAWTMLTFGVNGTLANYIQPSTYAIRIQVVSNNVSVSDAANIDYEAVVISYNVSQTATPPTASLTADPTSITSGQSPTLTWTSSAATSCTGSGFTPSGISGSTVVTPTVTTTYAVTCSGVGGQATGSATVTVATSAMWQPPLNSRLYYQLNMDGPTSTGGVNTTVCSIPFTGGSCVRPSVWDIDLYDASGSTVNSVGINAIHSVGGRAICYVDAGTSENFRPDYSSFPTSIQGNSNGWPGEKWLDIRATSILFPIIDARVAKCASAHFDAVEFDNMDGYTNNTGFPLTAAQQITYNKGVAAITHKYGLAVGLKNDVGQIPDLVSSYDFAINEQCHQYNECSNYTSYFIPAGKAVFELEYSAVPGSFCPPANSSNINASVQDLNLTSAGIYTPCR